jgi:putative endonuclease
MLANQRNGTLYIGMTSDLIKRIWQHREELADGFTKKYAVKMLVWYEQHETIESAICKEKAMKKWLRKWKLSTIEQFNPGWIDLWPEILGETAYPVIPANAGIQTEANRTRDNHPSAVIPANAGIQKGNELDSRIRGNDDSGERGTSEHQGTKLDSRIRGNDDGGVKVLANIRALL